jgi:hypothetical protein
MWNNITFDLLGNEPKLSVMIDGIDVLSMNEFKNDFIHAEAEAFLFSEYMWSGSDEYNAFNGEMLIGMCNCGSHGCDDVITKITTNTRTTKWIIMQDRNRKVKRVFSFKAKDYRTKIEELFEKYYSYSWETDVDRIRRLCTEHIRAFTTKDGHDIEGAKIAPVNDNKKNEFNILSNTIEIYYYSDWVPIGEGIGTPYHSWKIKFDGKTLDSAMKALNKFIIKEKLIKNDKELIPRKKPFRLLYTKDKNMIERLLKNNN